MARYADPFPQYIDSDGAPLSGAQVFFFITDTFTEADTFSDVELTILNANPVIADNAGKLPDIFLDASVLYRVQVLRADGSLFDQTDDIPGGGLTATDTGIAVWSPSVTYTIPDIVIGSDALTYQSYRIENFNKDPTLSPDFWTSYTYLKEWNEEETYILKFILQHDGLTYSSRIAANKNNEPDLSPDEWSNISGIGPQTIWVPAPSMSPLIVNGPSIGRVETTTNNILIHTLDFDPSVVESAQFFIQMPSSWDASIINAQVVWSTVSTSLTTTTVRWGLRAVAIANGDVLDAAFGTQVIIDDDNTMPVSPTLEQADNLPLTVAVDVVGDGPGEWVVFEIARLATAAQDDLTDNARLHGIRLQMTVNNSVESL